MLRLRGVCKAYDGRPVLSDVDLDVAPGEICALLGPNGAGKTTCISIVAGLRRADSGTVEVDGINVATHPSAARALLGLAPQDLGVYPTATVRENLLVFGALAGLRRAHLTSRINELAGALYLEPLLDRFVGQLSGGEKRRVHTAIALMHKPRLVLLDEPTVGADVETRGALLDVVRSLADEGAAVCYTSHYLGEIEALQAHVAILEAGSIIASGSVADLTRRHAPPMVELTFDGPAPVLDIPDIEVRDGNVLRLRAPEPAATAAMAITMLGEAASRLRSVELLRPGLESAYLALTGRRSPEQQEQLQ